MAKYRKVSSRIQNDAKFRELSDRGKLLFFLLLTHPNMTSLGAMRATEQGLAAEFGWPLEGFREAFREGFEKGLWEADFGACIVAFPNFIKYNRPESANVVKAWAKAVDLLPECALKILVIQRAKAFAEALPEAFGKAFREAFAKSMPYPEPEQEPEPEPDIGQLELNKLTSSRDGKIDFRTLPSQISAECAQNFIDHRIASDKPLTQHSFELAMSAAVMAALDCNVEPGRVIDIAIERSWSTVNATWVRKYLEENGEIFTAQQLASMRNDDHRPPGGLQ